MIVLQPKDGSHPAKQLIGIIRYIDSFPPSTMHEYLSDQKKINQLVKNQIDA